MAKRVDRALIDASTGKVLNWIHCREDWSPPAGTILVDKIPPYRGAIWNGADYDAPSPEVLAEYAAARIAIVERMAADRLAHWEAGSMDDLAAWSARGLELMLYAADQNPSPGKYPMTAAAAAAATKKSRDVVTKADMDSAVAEMSMQAATRAAAISEILEKKVAAIAAIRTATSLAEQLGVEEALNLP